MADRHHSTSVVGLNPWAQQHTSTRGQDIQSGAVPSVNHAVGRPTTVELRLPQHEFDVRDFGAAGDAKTDDTHAFQSAFDLCIASGGGTVVVPPGDYLIAGTVTVNTSKPAPPHSLRGMGWSSNLLWASDADLIVWFDPPKITVAELAISSIIAKKSVNSTALRVGTGKSAGAQRCEFDHLLFFGEGSVANTTHVATPIGTALDLGAVSDTTTVRDCVLWKVHGTGIVIGHGSEIRIEGGRIIGSVDCSTGEHNLPANATASEIIRSGSIGIHVTGDNGGVHVLSTDVIGHAIGMLLEDATGAGSNREIFITHATFDSDYVGLLIRDNSYVSIAGCWAASSDIAQIWLAPTAHGAQLTVAGGTIFNGGAYQKNAKPGSCTIPGGCNGLVADAGTFVLTGLLVRNNKGAGVIVRSPVVSHYSITGCQLFGNGVALDLQGSEFAVTGNVLHDNSAPNILRADESSIVTNNAGWKVNR
jgi:hypothetical protein